MDDCVVLVTGASGFLGKHVVSALQGDAKHVTEIRVFDKIPYNNTDCETAIKTVREFVGDINDTGILKKACEGVDSVIHLASVIDLGLKTDRQKSNLINVEGTRKLLNVARKCGVKRFIYCSSMATVMGFDDVNHATEDSTLPPPRHKNSVYGESKLLAERMVLEANCDEFRTLAIRPGILYGEFDWRYSSRLYTEGLFKNRFSPDLANLSSMDWVYVGNVAAAFVQCEETLRKNDWLNAGGEVFFIGDGTPKLPATSYYSPVEEFFIEAGYKPVLPLFLHHLRTQIIRIVAYTLCLIYIHVLQGQVQYEYWLLWPDKQTFILCYAKARLILGYKPKFSYEQAKQKTVNFIRSLKK